ncbi:MAG: hypothetical protein RIR73_1903 [Chloroflexota bacterium]|jgi:hypothetical protein
MGLFSNILEKLGLKKKEEAKPAAPAAASAEVKAAPKVAPKSAVASGSGMREAASKEHSLGEKAAPAPKAIDVVDVVAQLEAKAAGKDLNWKVSIVDLLKLLDLDSSREARAELAEELNAPADVKGDSARLNVWLHKEVLRQIAANGGNIPADLLD